MPVRGNCTTSPLTAALGALPERQLQGGRHQGMPRDLLISSLLLVLVGPSQRATILHSSNHVPFSRICMQATEGWGWDGR